MEFGSQLVVLLVGGVVGTISGLFGVGGGFLMVPTLTILAGVPAEIALGSSICQMLGPATTGLLHRRANKQLQLQMPLTMLGGVLVGLWWGFRFLDAIKESEMQIEQALLTCYFVLLVLLAGVVALDYHISGLHQKKRRGFLEGWYVPPMGRFEELGGKTCSLTILCLIGVLVGFLSGGLGMGGGIILLPILIYLVGVPTHQTISVALGLAWLTGLVATCGHAYYGHVDLRLVCLLLLGGTIGAKLGSQFNEKIGGRRLRGYFALIVLAVAAMVGFRLWFRGA